MAAFGAQRSAECSQASLFADASHAQQPLARTISTVDMRRKLSLANSANHGHLRNQGLQAPVSAWSAISNLEKGKGGTKPSADTKGFLEIVPSNRRTAYQKLMGVGAKLVSDLRLARHRPEIEKRFGEIIEICHAEGRLNTSVGADIRHRYGLKKQALRVLEPDMPSPTITSMPTIFCTM